MTLAPRCLSIAFLVCLLASPCLAEHLPIHSYTTADGLPRDRVTRIVQDSRGFIWLCTAEGLARFDGYHFQNYGTADGLPNRDVRDLKETRGGTYWIATSGGLAIFNPAAISPQATTPGRRFVQLVLDPAKKNLSVNKLLLDRSDVLWCATDNGVYRIERAANGEWRSVAIDFSLKANTRDLAVHDLIEDQQGSIWIATDLGLHRRDAAGHLTHYSAKDKLPVDAVSSLLQDRDGQFWAGTPAGLCRFVMAPDGTTIVPTRTYTTADGLSSNSVWSITQTKDGHLWVASGGLNLLESGPVAGSFAFRSYTEAAGLKGNAISSISEDSEGNLWLATETDGAEKIARSGLTSYSTADGLSNDRIAAIFEDRSGILRVAVTNAEAMLNRFDGGHFTSSPSRLPPGAGFGWGWSQIILQDRERDWWLAAGTGLYRYPSDSHGNPAMGLQPKAIYNQANGLGADEVFRIFEDTRGDIWFGTLGVLNQALGKWDRASQTFHLYTPAADGISGDCPTAFAEDPSGNIWIGFYSGGVARYRDGRFTMFRENNGVGGGFVRGLYFDSKQRLWISTSDGGVIRADDSHVPQPHFVALTTADGLASNQVTSVVEGPDGRLYIGTGRGVDQLDSESGRIRHFTTADGLPDSFINVSYRDHAGTLWFGTLRGLSKLVPDRREAKVNSGVLITGLRAGNGAYQSADLGAANISGLELSPGENRLQVDFVSPDFAPGQSLRYQYILEGADRDWTTPADQRSLNLASLAPGRYRLMVRSVDSEGKPGLQPATVSFRVLPPFWRRWWFIALTVLLIGAAIFGLDRYRVARMREIDAVNRKLSLEYEVTRLLAESDSMVEAMPKILQVICETLGWDMGAIWDVDSPARVLRCVTVWLQPAINATEFSAQTRTSTFAPGEGFPGRVWATAAPLWVADLSSDTKFPRLKAASNEGFRSAFGFPILLGEEVIGVIEFFKRDHTVPDPELLEMMRPIGAEIGQLIVRRRGEDALRESEGRFRTLADTASDAIITIDEQSTIVYINATAEKIFGYPIADMLGADLTILMPEYLRHLHRAGLARYAETGRRHIGWSAVELPGLHRDGHEIPLELSFGEFTANDRRYFTGIARDITERKHAEEELRRTREDRLRELERVRKRIATDLHDDVGSSLTRISLLSEVAQRQGATDGSAAGESLSVIAGLSRELVDSMSDIVWAINPERDSLGDLTQRMRHFASDLFAARDIGFRFRLPEVEHEIKLGANIRRELFLIFKEAVNNIVRHSGSTEVEIEFRVESDGLFLRLKDNGRGFDVLAESNGHGLASMRERVEGLGGTLEMTSQTGAGSMLVFVVPTDQDGARAPGGLRNPGHPA